MFANIIANATFALVAAGVLFQLLTLARLTARIAREQVARRHFSYRRLFR